MSERFSPYAFLTSWLQQERPGGNMRLCDFDRIRQELKPCDVLLIDGHSHLDLRLKGLTNSRWSRALLYLGRLHDIEDPALRATVAEYYPCQADTQLVFAVHLDRGTVLQSITAFEFEHVRICRPRGLPARDAQEVIRYAISRVGTVGQSSWTDILRLFYPWFLLPRRWRAGLFARMAGQLLRCLTGTCIGEAFGFIQFPVLPLVKRTEHGATRLYRRHPRIFYPADFDHSPYFDVVKYPFVDTQMDHRVAMLPWKGNATDLNNGEETGKSATERLTVVVPPAHQQQK